MAIDEEIHTAFFQRMTLELYRSGYTYEDTSLRGRTFNASGAVMYKMGKMIAEEIAKDFENGQVKVTHSGSGNTRINGALQIVGRTLYPN